MKQRTPLLILASALLLLLATEWLLPRPTDWTVSLDPEDTRPYGTKVLREQWSGLFPDHPVAPSSLSFYEYLEQESAPRPVLISLSTRFSPDSVDLAALLAYVESGGQLLVAAHWLGAEAQKAFGMRTVAHGPAIPIPLRKDSVSVRLLNPTFSAGGHDSFYFDRGMLPSRLYPTDSTQRGRVVAADSAGHAVAVYVRRGAGALLLTSAPLAFTNYHLLRQPDATLAAGLLSYLPPKEALLTTFYQTGRQLSGSPLRYVLSQPALRSAYYLTVGGLLLVVLVEVRRRQRVIPVVRPPANTSLAFAETVGNLYFRRGDHHDLALKKITYWLEGVRTHYQLPTNHLDDAFVARLSQRSGYPVAALQKAVSHIGRVRASTRLPEVELMQLHEQLTELRPGGPAASIPKPHERT